MSSSKSRKGQSLSQPQKAKLNGFIYKKLEKSMKKTLTIKFEKLKSGKQTGYMAVIKELGDSMIMADTMAEVFEQLPVVIAACEKNKIGLFAVVEKIVV